ncbi:hypothetical protein CCHR01_14150 [Colletotrichum chrysophilum]|uniref:Uncharacterized protein n=1 Tax=Colletotrichum chrysophilum TaxID=1836956 RepID=A0AAD9AD03_9PEZI|nr:hypothetical protein CCHR01_14150 [Colletotrichum chrysophilum]
MPARQTILCALYSSSASVKPLVSLHVASSQAPALMPPSCLLEPPRCDGSSDSGLASGPAQEASLALALMMREPSTTKTTISVVKRKVQNAAHHWFGRQGSVNISTARHTASPSTGSTA